MDTLVTTRSRPSTFSILVVPAMLLVLSVIASAGMGAVKLPFGEVVRALLHPAEAGDAGIILFTLRLPRVLAAGLVGAGLSATGVLFQGLFRNPLADPFVLGASGGAALGGAIAVFLVPALTFAGVGAIELLAFAGSLLAMVIVWNVAKAAGHFAMENMLLAGFAIGTMLNAATSALALRQESTNQGMRILAAWLHGEVTVPSWTQISVIAVIEIAALLIALPLARQLNTLALSEEYAAQLGVRVERLQILVVVTGSVLTALAVSLGGLIGFVGLLVPHFLRLILGPDHFRLLPVSALCGAIFLIVADTIARTAFAPSEIPVGMLTALLGGPAFLYLLNHRQRSSTH
jgi:iron complex transport system permease protein